MENLLAIVVALCISSIFMWVWNFCLHSRITKLELASEQRIEVKE